MTDIVRILEKYTQDKSFIFHYGRQNVINLIETGNNWTGSRDDIYLLLEFRNIKPRMNNSKTNSVGVDYTGTFYLVKHSDLDQNFFQEVGTQNESKYVNNIEPLLTELDTLVNYFGCSDVEYETTNAIDVTDFIDANADGLMIMVKAFVPKQYTIANGNSSS